MKTRYYVYIGVAAGNSGIPIMLSSLFEAFPTWSLEATHQHDETQHQKHHHDCLSPRSPRTPRSTAPRPGHRADGRIQPECVEILQNEGNPHSSKKRAPSPSDIHLLVPNLHNGKSYTGMAPDFVASLVSPRRDFKSEPHLMWSPKHVPRPSDQTQSRNLDSYTRSETSTDDDDCDENAFDTLSFISNGTRKFNGPEVAFSKRGPHSMNNGSNPLSEGKNHSRSEAFIPRKCGEVSSLMSSPELRSPDYRAAAPADTQVPARISRNSTSCPEFTPWGTHSSGPSSNCLDVGTLAKMYLGLKADHTALLEQHDEALAQNESLRNSIIALERALANVRTEVNSGSESNQIENLRLLNIKLREEVQWRAKELEALCDNRKTVPFECAGNKDENQFQNRADIDGITASVWQQLQGTSRKKEELQLELDSVKMMLFQERRRREILEAQAQDFWKKKDSDVAFNQKQADATHAHGFRQGTNPCLDLQPKVLADTFNTKYELHNSPKNVVR